MNSLEVNSNDDTFKRTNAIKDEDACSKTTTPTSSNTIPTFPITKTDNNISTVGNEPPIISDSSQNYSLIYKDLLVPLGNPRLKNLKYIENEIPIYTNLYKIELERNYTLYEYAVNFNYDKDDQYSLSTPF